MATSGNISDFPSSSGTSGYSGEEFRFSDSKSTVTSLQSCTGGPVNQNCVLGSMSLCCINELQRNFMKHNME